MLEKVLVELKKRSDREAKMEKLFNDMFEVSNVNSRLKRHVVNTPFLNLLDLSHYHGNINMIKDFLKTKGVGETVINGHLLYTNIKEKKDGKN